MQDSCRTRRGSFLRLSIRGTADPDHSSHVMGTSNSVRGHQIWISDLHGARAESTHKTASSHLGPEQLLYSLLGSSLGMCSVQGGLVAPSWTYSKLNSGKVSHFHWGASNTLWDVICKRSEAETLNTSICYTRCIQSIHPTAYCSFHLCA